MAVHGRYGKPCLRCDAKIQRIRYASNETDYCPHCQTGGKLLADRSLSRLLRQDWPRTPEELEERRRAENPDHRFLSRRYSSERRSTTASLATPRILAFSACPLEQVVPLRVPRHIAPKSFPE